jgi:predicted TIM-barrel fold metal-dependent hydrolase
VVVIDHLDIDDEARRKIYVGNAEKLIKRKPG